MNWPQYTNSSQYPWKSLKCQREIRHDYPVHLIKHIELEDGCKLTLRPICPTDKALLQNFVSELSLESRYMRFMHSVSELTPYMLQQFTNVDYRKTMAFLAIAHSGENKQLVGVVRYAELEPSMMGEFALVITDKFQHRGLGTIMMNVMTQHAREQGLQWLQASILQENSHMLNLMQRLHFHIHRDPHEHGVVIASKAITA